MPANTDPLRFSNTGTRAAPKVFLKVQVEPDVRDALVNIAARTPCTLSEAVRRALRVAVASESEPKRSAAEDEPAFRGVSEPSTGRASMRDPE